MPRRASIQGMDDDAIDVSGLVKTFGSFRALDGLELQVATGEVHGFLGPNGAGQVHDDPRPARAAARRRGRACGCSAATRGTTPWRCTAGSPTCPAT